MFTESGDLGVRINLGESEIMEIGRVKIRVRENLNLGELESEVFERADGDDAVGGRGIMVGVGLNGETPMEPRGDESAEKEDRITGDFGEVSGGIIDEEMVVVGGFETHDASFERALALAESLSGNATSELSGRGFIFANFRKNLLDFGDGKIYIIFYLVGSERFLVCHNVGFDICLNLNCSMFFHGVKHELMIFLKKLVLSDGKVVVIMEVFKLFTLYKLYLCKAFSNRSKNDGKKGEKAQNAELVR